MYKMEFLERQDRFVAGAVLSRGGAMPPPCLPPLLLCPTWARGGLQRGTWLAAQVGLGAGVSPVPLAGVHGAAEPCLSVGACGVSQAVNSRKLPGRHIEGAGWGRARAPSQQMCLQG